MNEVSAIIGFSSSADTVSLGHFRLCATAASRPRLSAEVRRLELEHVVLLRLHVIGTRFFKLFSVFQVLAKKTFHV